MRGILAKSIDVSEVYSATLALFRERGFTGTTTREIAVRAGVNEVTLFRRFGSKAALMQAAIGDAIADAPFGQVLPGDDPQADLCEVVRAYLATYEKYGGLVLTLFAQLPHHPELSGIAPTLFRNMQNVAAIMAAHQQGGRIRAGDPGRFAVELIAPLAVIGMMKEMGAGPGHKDFDVPDYVRTFLSGHGASASA